MIIIQKKPETGAQASSGILHLSTEQNTMLEIGSWTSVLMGLLLSNAEILLICIIHSSALAAK